MLKFLCFVAYLSIASFILFTSASFVSLGFSLQGTLVQVIEWSVITAVLLALGYAILGGLVAVIFGLASFGRVGEFLVGAVVGAGVLFGLGVLLPSVMAFPTVASAVVAGALGSAIIVALGSLTGRLTFKGKMLPRRKTSK
jgi:hypothetical protein